VPVADTCLYSDYGNAPPDDRCTIILAKHVIISGMGMMKAVIRFIPGEIAYVMTSRSKIKDVGENATQRSITKESFALVYSLWVASVAVTNKPLHNSLEVT
jgi:hypothetical protein